MGLPEYLSIAALVLAIATLVLMILLLRRHEAKEDADEIHRLNAEITERLADLKEGVSQTLFDSIMKFNDQVNNKLNDNNSKSAENITNFRIDVNKELGDFQEKISSRLNDSFIKLNDSFEKRMGMINEKVEDRLSKGFVETNQTFQKIAERVAIIDDAQKNIQDLSKEMVGLQKILTNNQSRGSFGEYQLNQLLFSVFGDNKSLYETQYVIREASGKRETVRADAVIFMPEQKLIAIDSKFPFSTYSKLFDNRELSREEEDKTISLFGADVKKHITDIAAKYIVPELTSDYALMFVASDGILALLHSRLQNVIEYARSKKVTIVSPTTLIPMLSSFWAFSIDYKRSQYTKEISEQLMGLKKEFDKFGEEWIKLNENIQKLTKQSSEVNNRVEKITTKFVKIKNVEFLEEEPQKRLESLPDPDIKND
jgi:DNA recombination protein RmuC